MRFRKIVGASFITFASCFAASAQQMTITAECTTEDTGGDGVRHDCQSSPSVGTAPEGFVFNQNEILLSKTSGNGDEHRCDFGWGDFKEVIPDTGITQPSTFTLSAFARSPSGHWAGRGWANCTATISLVKFK